MVAQCFPVHVLPFPGATRSSPPRTVAQISGGRPCALVGGRGLSADRPADSHAEADWIPHIENTLQVLQYIEDFSISVYGPKVISRPGRPGIEHGRHSEHIRQAARPFFRRLSPIPLDGSPSHDPRFPSLALGHHADGFPWRGRLHLRYRRPGISRRLRRRCGFLPGPLGRPGEAGDYRTAGEDPLRPYRLFHQLSGRTAGGKAGRPRAGRPRQGVLRQRRLGGH